MSSEGLTTHSLPDASTGSHHEFDSERRELLDMLLEAAHDGFLDWNLRSGVVYFSPRFKAMIGFEDESFPTTHQEWNQLTHAEDRPAIVAAIAELMAGDWPFDLQFRLKHRIAGWRWLRCRAAARRDEQGNVMRVVATFSDVSEQILAQRRQASLVTAIPDLLIRVQSDSTVIDVKTPEGDVAYSTKVPRVGERLIAAAFTCGWCSEAQQALNRALCERQPSQFETRLRLAHASSEPCEIEVRVFPSTDDEALFVIRDITQEKQRREQGLQSQKLEAIGQLAAGIAHEINTPLQFVGDNLHFLAEAANTLAQALERYRVSVPETLASELRQLDLDMDLEYMTDHLNPALSAALDGIARVSTIVRAMKSFSHPEVRAKRPEDLNDALETTITLSTSVWKYVAEIERDFAKDLPRVDCTIGSINQVFLNVITNAAHAIADVVGESGAKGRIRITTRHDAESVEIRIADTGTGISEATRSRVFEPFFTTKPVGQGTGQGLSLARSIVQQHHGTIDFKSEEGKGTTFCVRLPLRAPESVTANSRR